MPPTCDAKEGCRSAGHTQGVIKLLVLETHEALCVEALPLQEGAQLASSQHMVHILAVIVLQLEIT